MAGKRPRPVRVAGRQNFPPASAEPMRPLMALLLPILCELPPEGLGVLARDVAIEDVLEMGAAASDAALHGADGAAGDLGGGLIGEAARAHQQERLALRRGQAFEGALEVLEVEMLLLAAARGRLVL